MSHAVTAPFWFTPVTAASCTISHPRTAPTSTARVSPAQPSFRPATRSACATGSLSSCRTKESKTNRASKIPRWNSDDMKTRRASEGVCSRAGASGFYARLDWSGGAAADGHQVVGHRREVHDAGIDLPDNEVVKVEERRGAFRIELPA